MDTPEIPPFSPSNEKLQTGKEFGFANSKKEIDKYLSGISGDVEEILYTLSPRWGYVVRIRYISSSIYGKVSHGNIVCWSTGGLTNIAFDVDEFSGKKLTDMID
jgi:hypothetical protein